MTPAQVIDDFLWATEEDGFSEVFDEKTFREANRAEHEETLDAWVKTMRGVEIGDVFKLEFTTMRRVK